MSRGRGGRTAPVVRRSLALALGVGRRGVYAFVGAGGKTAAIQRLLVERPRALATTTTHLARSGFGAGLLVVAPDAATLASWQARLGRARPLGLALGGAGDRVAAPPLAWQWEFSQRHAGDLVLVEADGARRRFLKLPGPHEPAWPPARLAAAVVVAGCGALGAAVSAVVHSRAASRRGGRGGERVGPRHVARMLSAYARATPPRTPLVVLLTGIARDRRALALQLGRGFLGAVRARDPRVQDPGVPVRLVATPDVATGPFWVWDFGRASRRGRHIELPGVCGVLLAAGLGTRFEGQGDSKLLARWRGRTLVEHAVREWSGAGFASLCVVTGHDAAAVERRVRSAAGQATSLLVVRNPRPGRGLGSSVRAAARAAPPGCGLLFGHADMPRVRAATLRRIADLGTTLGRWIVIPTVGGRRVNPVFFPADLRAELRRVGDASGGRPVFAAHPERVFRLPVDDAAAQFVDVDRTRDLARLR